MSEDAGRPDLLDGIFDESGESSSSGEEEETTADLILRAVSTLGAKSGFVDKWINDKDKQFFYSSDKEKLICFVNGNYLEYIGNGKYVAFREDAPSGNSANITDDAEEIEKTQEKHKSKTCWVTEIPESVLSVIDKHNAAKRQRTEGSNVPSLSLEELVGNAEVSIPGISEFVQRWALEEASVRHLLKMDRLMVAYIVKQFNPTKAKAKNALLGMIEALAKYPQKWRIHALREQELFDECCTRHIEDVPLNIVSGDLGESDEKDFVLDLESPGSLFSFQIFPIESDLYFLNLKEFVLVDGMRVVPEDGPVALKDGSVIAVTPNHILLVEIGDPDFLIARRSPPSAQTYSSD